ncbi:MAG: DUF814 domain-containing protein [Candidatus Heimdallarchaeota archaeon]|nr:DUF814 domain-containing protein [Candidatus Heimdallarchaeota archaeon]
MLSGIDLRLLTRELKDEIVGTWIVNIYHLPNNILIFKLRKSGSGLLFLLIEPGKRIHLTEFNRIMPKTPSNFCVTMRKHLREKRINDVVQQELDRVSIINIGPEPGYNLVIELFGFGNSILVSPLNKIITALRYRKMRDRDIHPGRDFIQLPPQARDILKSDLEDLDSVLAGADKVIPAMNTWLGLGPYYSRYIAKMAGVSKKKVIQLEAEDKQKLLQAAQKLKTILEEYRFEPVVYLEKNETVKATDEPEGDLDDQLSDEIIEFDPENVIKISPLRIASLHSDSEAEKFIPPSFNKAIDIWMSSQEHNQVMDEEVEELQSRSSKFEKLLNLQLNHQKDFFKEASAKREKADALYLHFNDTTELISTVYEARKKKMSWEEIKEKLELGKQKGIKSAMLLKQVNEAQANLVLDIPTDGKNVEVTIDFRKSLTENANELYQQAKKAKSKGEKAEIAIVRTQSELANADKISEETRSEMVTNVTLLKRRKRWYEKFHWTYLHNEYLVICGTDALSNEMIIKRYLEDGDLFLHADLQGAATTVIKTEGREISEKIQELAASMAISYSAAWRAKLTIGDVFIVDRDQVSLTPPSGEFLPKGSVMIYGEKTFIRNRAIELYIGLVIEQNWARLVYGPLEGIELASYWVKIVPGHNDRGKVAKQIREKFLQSCDDNHKPKLKALNVSEIAWIIPSDSKIVEFSKQEN